MIEDLDATDLRMLERIERLVTERRFTARLPREAVSVTINAVGEIQSISVSPSGRKMDLDEIIAAVARLQRQALADSRKAVEAAVRGTRDDQPDGADPYTEYEVFKRRSANPGVIDSAR